MDYYLEIKNLLLNNEIYFKVKDYSKENYKLKTYYSVGKLLMDAGKHYGEGIINEYSNKLTKELGKGYDQSNLKRMRQFYIMIEKGVAMPHFLTWSHIISLLTLKDKNMINYYINICKNNNLSYRELRVKIKNKEYERLSQKTKSKLILRNKTNIEDYVKEPVIIKNNNNCELISEKILQKIIVENITDFMKELGNNYSFIDSEYKIKIGNNYNYIDLLLYNIEYNCYVVIELKVTSLKKEHIGQIEVYMNYIDCNLKKKNQNKTIGIILVKKNNKFLIEYKSNKKIISREYIILNV